MNLHLGASVPEPARGLAGELGKLGPGEEPPVQLRGSDVRNHRLRRRVGAAAGDGDPGGLTSRDSHRVDVRARLEGSAALLDDPYQRLYEPDASSARNGHPAELDRDRHHLGHEAGGGRVGTEAGVQHPRREQPVHALATRTASVAQSRHVDSRFPANSSVPRRPNRRYARSASLRPSSDQSSVPSRPKARSAFGMKAETTRSQASPSPAACPSHSATFVACEVVRKNARAVREDRGGGQVGVQVLEAARVQVVLQLRVGARADEERMPRGEDLVDEAGLCDLGGPDRAADVIVALEHEHTPAGLREQGGAGQRVDPAADDDHVIGAGHRPTSTSRRSSGNEQSFSLPSTPMRKLSSTRRPPPPGQ